MIGEAILLEVDGVSDITYSKIDYLDTIFVELEDGNFYELTLKNISTNTKC